MSEPIPQPGVQFSVNDRGGEYYTKLQQLAAAIDSAITAFNQSVAAGDDAGSYLQQIQDIQNAINGSFAETLAAAQLIRDQTQAISESGLPAQAGNKHKALVTSGNGISWQFPATFNRKATASFELEAGDIVQVIATEEVVITMPEVVSVDTPFAIRNSNSSTAEVLLHIRHPVITHPSKPNLQPGDVVSIGPGQPWRLVAIEENILELVL